MAAALIWRARAGRSAFVLTALLVTVAGLGAGTGLLLARVRAGQAAQDARTAAVVAAKQEVPALLSYSYQTFRAGLARAEADTTGRFGASYRKLMTGHVEPAALAGHVVAQTSVAAASVISAEPGTARLLLFLGEQTRTDARQQPVLNDTAVRVTMRQVNGTWLVAGLVPRS